MTSPAKKKKIYIYIKGITTHTAQKEMHRITESPSGKASGHVTVFSVYNYTLSCKMALAVLTSVSSYESKKGSKIKN